MATMKDNMISVYLPVGVFKLFVWGFGHWDTIWWISDHGSDMFSPRMAIDYWHLTKTGIFLSDYWLDCFVNPLFSNIHWSVHLQFKQMHTSVDSSTCDETCWRPTNYRYKCYILGYVVSESSMRYWSLFGQVDNMHIKIVLYNPQI